MKWLIQLLIAKNDGADPSKTKGAALLTAAIGALLAFGVELTPQQVDAIQFLALAAIAIFMRDGIDKLRR